MNLIIEWALMLYVYCTDFIINLANVLSLSYYEVNFGIFIIIYPVLFFTAMLVYFVQRNRLKNHLKKAKSKLIIDE